MTRPSGRVLAALPLLLLALAFAAPGALAAPSGEEWSDEPRSVTAWPDGGGFTMRSTRDSEVASDELAAEYDAQSANLAVTLNAIDPTQTTMSVVLAVLAVTEFEDSDGDGRLGLGETVVRRVSVPGTPASSSVEPLPGGGWRAVSTHALPGPPPSLGTDAAASSRLEVVLEARPEAEDGAEPTRLDLDLRVIDGWARNGTHLAVEAELGSTTPPEDLSADAARVRAGDHRMAATWQDGRGTVVEGTDARSMTFVRAQPASHLVSFPAALSASWVPADGPGLDAPGGQPLLYLGAAVVAAAAFVVPAWRRLRAR